MSEPATQRHRNGPVKADSDLVRRQNRSLVLSALRRRTPLARVDLGAATALSPATITAITADLIGEGLIETVTVDPAECPEAADVETPVRRGRPRILLQLDSRAALVLGIKIAINQVTLILADFTGVIVARANLTPRTLAETRDSFPRTLIGLVRDFLATHRIPLARIAEVSIAAQGFVDAVSGSVMWSPAFRDRDVRLVGPLEDAFEVPCVISNDANMIAEALHAQDPEIYGDTFAVIFVDYGVGMGLFVGGHLHAGANGSAAEFGHMNHIPHGPLCRCGRHGCIEAYVADYAIWREAQGMPPDTDPRDASPSRDDLKALEAAAAAGDARIRAIYEQAGEALGYGLARLMALVNPSRIVFTGGSTRAFPLIEPAMNRAIDDALVEDLRRFTVFETLPDEKDMIITGLIADALARLDRDVFSNPSNARRFRAEG
ncbi:ROK family protein [Chthonobacter rhizosphaerae]|uniref:ROK family protein n=1 Tax=Chthonobacter rhizosphaerae TaxID=2735553 RepID=UPI0015EE41C5|nr:ROK family protein [Chthonobacter rhizosphaerae]